MVKYDRFEQDKRRGVIRNVQSGSSMARTASSKGISGMEVYIILHEVKNTGNPVFLCHDLSVNLIRNGLSVKEYWTLYVLKISCIDVGFWQKIYPHR
jgi:hypothetical protein